MGRPVQMMALVVTLAASSIAECGGTAFQAVTNEHSLKGRATGRKSTSRPASKATGGTAFQAVKDEHSLKGRATGKKDTPAKAAEEALAKLKAIDDKDIPEPLALGDALYLAGRKRGAVIFYEKAMKRLTPDDTKATKSPSPDNTKATRRLSPEKKADAAWILYQLGNCHRTSDPDVAAGYYNRVVSEHGGSDWAFPSKVQGDLIKWHRQNKPAELIKAAIVGSKAS